MKTLYLLRHAKSDRSDPGLGDFDRPLAARGAEAARRMGRALADRGLVADEVVCSAARRAVETWELLAAAAPPTGARLNVLRGLYLATPGALLQVLRRRPDDANAVMLIGHNPGLADLARRLSGPGSNQGPLRRLTAKVPTGALAAIEFDVERWSEIGDGMGRLILFLRPRDLE